jgi:predicted TIM-barrel fold metal-dependent hydrolase
VQHLGEYDNSYIGGILRTYPDQFAGVMLVDLDSPDPVSQLKRWITEYPFRGVRLLARTLGSHSTIWRRAAALGLNIVVYEEPTIAAYADELLSFACQHRGTRLVISHMGMLDRSEVPSFQGQRRLRILSEQPNVYVQLSGFHMFGKSPYRDQLPVVECLTKWFGVERLLYGSNFPVPKDEETCRQEFELLRSGKLGVPTEAREQVFSRTAMDLWFN